MNKIVSNYQAWWTFRIFFIFSCSGRGKEESEAPGGGGIGFLIENSRTGGGGAGSGRAAGRVSAANLGIFWGGGANFFFGGRNVHQANVNTTC